MTDQIPAKRRRGGQPGNQNALGNRGNRTPRRNRIGRGGGAPFGNQNAQKKPKAPHVAVLQDYKDDPEAVAWITANSARLDEGHFTADDQRDAALYSGFTGLTPEALAESGKEFKFGLYTLAHIDNSENEDAAA